MHFDHSTPFDVSISFLTRCYLMLHGVSKCCRVLLVLHGVINVAWCY